MRRSRHWFSFMARIVAYGFASTFTFFVEGML